MSAHHAIPSGLLGRTIPPLTQRVDARWMMAYAAALGETDARYFDTAGKEPIRAHPLFPVCFEWPAWISLLEAVPGALLSRGVHATHDLVVHRTPVADEMLVTQARVVEIVRRRAGVFVMLRFDTTDEAGRPVAASRAGMVFRGVECEAEGVLPETSMEEGPPRAPGADVRAAAPISIGAGLAHVYSECSRIWNPIHTDRSVALAAGLPNPVLHGTATLALAVSAILRVERATAATRVRCRFTAPVGMPATLRVEILEEVRGEIAFRVVNDGGMAVIEAGWIVLAT